MFVSSFYIIQSIIHWYIQPAAKYSYCIRWTMNQHQNHHQQKQEQQAPYYQPNYKLEVIDLTCDKTKVEECHINT